MTPLEEVLINRVRQLEARVKHLETEISPATQVPTTGVDSQELADMLRAGYTHAQLMEHFNRSSTAIHNAKRKAKERGYL